METAVHKVHSRKRHRHRRYEDHKDRTKNTSVCNIILKQLLETNRTTSCAITQNRLTMRMGVFNQGKTSETVSRTSREEQHQTLGRPILKMLPQPSTPFSTPFSTPSTSKPGRKMLKKEDRIILSSGDSDCSLNDLSNGLLPSSPGIKALSELLTQGISSLPFSSGTEILQRAKERLSNQLRANLQLAQQEKENCNNTDAVCQIRTNTPVSAKTMNYCSVVNDEGNITKVQTVGRSSASSTDRMRQFSNASSVEQAKPNKNTSWPVASSGASNVRGNDLMQVQKVGRSSASSKDGTRQFSNTSSIKQAKPTLNSWPVASSGTSNVREIWSSDVSKPSLDCSNPSLDISDPQNFLFFNDRMSHSEKRLTATSTSTNHSTSQIHTAFDFPNMQGTPVSVSSSEWMYDSDLGHLKNIRQLKQDPSRLHFIQADEERDILDMIETNQLISNKPSLHTDHYNSNHYQIYDGSLGDSDCDIGCSDRVNLAKNTWLSRADILENELQFGNVGVLLKTRYSQGSSSDELPAWDLHLPQQLLTRTIHHQSPSPQQKYYRRKVF